MMRSCTVGLIVVAGAACGGDPSPDRSVEQAGIHEVGTSRSTITDTSRGRTLVMQTWYPTETAATDVPIEMLEVEPIRTRYADLLAAAPSCARRTAHVALDAPIATGNFPIIAYSHCHDGTRLSNATTAERLASQGFVVVSVDHLNNTLWEHLDGDPDANLDMAFLEVRTADVRFALDQLEAGALAGSLDPEKVGVFGHSFGGVTAGRVAETDPRIVSAAALAAPMENALIPGVTLANLKMPLMFDVMVEDNSITELGNLLIRNNFKAAPEAAYKLEVSDAGHWSVSDLDGLVEPLFAPGCGDGVRQTDSSAFTYRDPETVRAITAAYVTAFFRATLQGDGGALAYLEHGFPVDIVTADHR